MTLSKPKPLTLKTIYSDLLKIARTTGTKSQDAKVGIIVKMLVASTPVEAKFIIRALQGKLRIG
jgi:DNA ligase-1